MLKKTSERNLKMLKHEWVYRYLCEEIIRILDRSGKGLPTEEDLCRTCHVSRQTLRKAISRLKSENVITSRQGSGMFLTGIYPGRINQIVLIVQDPEAYMTPVLISKISGYFAARHFHVSVIATGGSRNTEGQTLQKLMDSPPRGMFIQCISGAVPTPYQQFFLDLEHAGTRIVFLGERYPNVSSGIIASSDDMQGSFEMTEHLISLGHRRIGCLFISDSLSGHEKYLGFSQAMLSHGLMLHDEQVCWISEREIQILRSDRSRTLLQRILQEYPPEITALLCQNDELAFHVVRSIREPGSVLSPGICVTGFDNSYLLETGTVSFLTMETDSPEEFACSLMYQALLGSRPDTGKMRWKLIGAG